MRMRIFETALDPARSLTGFMEIEELERAVVALVNAKAEESGLTMRYGEAGIAYDSTDPEDEEWR